MPGLTVLRKLYADDATTHGVFELKIAPRAVFVIVMTVDARRSHGDIRVDGG